MKVLVTGHTGFIGKAVADHFTRIGYEVIGIARRERDDCAYEQHNINIGDEPALLEFFRSTYEIDIIIHCAGKAIVSECEANPYEAFSINSLGTAAILECARLTNTKKIIVIETDRIYGDANDTFIENSPLRPISAYGYSKASGANISMFYRKHYGLNLISVRPVNIFGHGDVYSRFIPTILRSIRNDEPISVYGSVANNYRDFLYINDFTKMLELIATKLDCSCHTYNLSPTSPKTIFDIAKNISEDFGISELPLIVGDLNVCGIKQTTDGSRFNTEFDFKFTNFDSAIRETYMEMLK